MAVFVEKISTHDAFELAMGIRQKVFVEEQEVPADEEYDEYESSSTHFLAQVDGVAAGTARWRFTDKGIKLERFAVKKEFRSSCVGSALLAAVLADIAAAPNTQDKKMYMHAQISAMGLYAKFGFEAEGEKFKECNIEHYKMSKPSV